MWLKTILVQLNKMQLVQHKQRRMFIYLKSLEMCQFRDALTLQSHNFLNWYLTLRRFHYSLYARCILSWGRALGPFGGLSTGQLNCCLPGVEEKRRREEIPWWYLKRFKSCVDGETDTHTPTHRHVLKRKLQPRSACSSSSPAHAWLLISVRNSTSCCNSRDNHN